MDRQTGFLLALIFLVVATVGGQSPAASPANAPSTHTSTPPAASSPSTTATPPPAMAPVLTPPAAAPVSTPPAAAPVPTPPSPTSVNSPLAPVSSPPDPVLVTSPPTPIPVSSPPSPTPVTATPPSAVLPPLALAPLTESPAKAPVPSKKGKKRALAPAPELSGPPAPPTAAHEPSTDSMLSGPATGVNNDQSGAEKLMGTQKSLVRLVMGGGVLGSLFFFWGHYLFLCPTCVDY